MARLVGKSTAQWGAMAGSVSSTTKSNTGDDWQTKKIGMPEQPFRVLCADPAWSFGDSLPGKSRGAAKNYRTMTVDEIERFELPPLATDCYLFLWRVASMQQEALNVVRCWGFTVKTEIVWSKKTKHGKQHYGMGRHVRAAHETCLVCVRGKPKPGRDMMRSLFEAKTGAHSQKPEEFYAMIESSFRGPFAELFARRHRRGWTCLGDELQGSSA